MIALRSFAKINLGLEITGRRADGYHTLRTIFQTIDLADQLELRETRNDRSACSAATRAFPGTTQYHGPRLPADL